MSQYQAKASYQTELLLLLSEYVFSSRKAAGNIMMEGYYELGDASVMWIVERWTSEKYYEENKTGIAAKNISNIENDWVVSPVETLFLTDLELLMKDGRQNKMEKGEQMRIMLFVDVKPGSEDHFMSINRDVITAFRNEPGLLVFRLSRFINDRTRFVVYKKFRNKDAFQMHLRSAAIVPVIQFLQTSVKEQPFEKGYLYLIEFAPIIR
ncbi:MAG TPA: antibiotic biosynthesis monooxygenase [Niastella sp.]